MGEVDDETRWVAAVENEAIDHMKVSWAGKEWPYKGGLMSGMRFTSLAGTILSAAAGMHVRARLQEAGFMGEMKVCSMGDDMVLAGRGEMPPKTLILEAYAETGFKANAAKTVLGQVADYLRGVYAPRGICHYPAISIGTLSYANPWLESFNLEKEIDVSTVWQTLYSRLLPHTTQISTLTSFVQTNIVVHLKTLLRFPADAPC